MKRGIILILFLASLFLHAQEKNAVQKTGDVCTHGSDAIHYYDWNKIEKAFSKRLAIPEKKAKDFFVYAFSKGQLKMSDYYAGVNAGTITAANADQYWLSKIPLCEQLYNNEYQAQLASEKLIGSNSVMNSCNNLDFGTGTLNNWTGEWNNQGTSGNIINGGTVQGYGNLTMSGFYTSGTNSVEYVHEICTPGNDPNVPVSRVPPGHNYSVRLGNDSALRQNMINAFSNGLLPFYHQTISNTFLVTPANKTIIYWYAVVLTQSSSSPHPQNMQPYFKIRMYDGTGNEIMCAHYDVDATTASSIGGFQSVFVTNNEILYKDWSQVLIPLQNYMGQNVTIVFETSDCAGGGHSGYTYLAVDCAPFSGITSTNDPCTGTKILTAPGGLSSYSWSGPGIVGSSAGQNVSVNAAGSYSVTMTTLGNSGFNCSLNLDTIVGPPPQPVTVAFTTNTVCVGGSPTQFTDASTLNGGAITSYSWNFGDGTTSTSFNPTHTYATQGIFLASYTITTSQGCTKSVAGNVVVIPTPVASFVAPAACEGNPTHFINTSTGGSTYNWNFGNGSGTSTVQSPTYTYTTAGTYNVTYTVTATGGCTNTYSAAVIVNPSPSASFTASTVCEGIPTVFTNTSTGAITAYNWGFGDGIGSSPTQSPTYTYGGDGNYAATLIIYNSFNCTSTATNTVIVHPVPVVSFLPSVACQGLPTTFTNATQPATGVNYSWDFGDGSSLSTQQSPSHTYNTLATYTVTLNASTAFGCASSGTNTVTVQPIPSLALSSPAAVCSGVAVPSPSYTVNPVTGVSYTWSNSNVLTGLSASGAGIPPVFTSASNITPGDIVSTVTVIPNLNGCIGPPATETITVKPTPVVTHTDIDLCPSQSSGIIGFAATPVVPAANISWTNTTPSVVSGLAPTSGTGDIPSFTTVNSTGISETTLFSIQANLNGCTGPSATFSLTINPFPDASFTYPNVCVGNPMIFVDSSTIGSGSVAQWDWDMDNDGTYDTTLQNPTWTFITAGNHTISLLVVSNKGCRDSISQAVYVNPSPIVSFTGDSAGCSPYTTQLTGTAYIAWPQYIQSWAWDAGNGNYFSGNGFTNSVRDSIVATYTNNSATLLATFSPTFQAVTNLGCITSLTRSNFITAYPQPKAEFTWYPETPDIINPEISFTSQATGASGWNAYTWYFGDVFTTDESSNYDFVANPTHTYSDQLAYSYEVMQAVQNIYGCKDTIYKTLTILDAWTFYIPNAFTPNRDYKNDGFKGTGIGIDNSTFNLWIFDRWGNMIFHSTDLEQAWDGTLQGEKVLEDTYVWKVEFEDSVHHEPHEYKGVVSVVK